MANSKTNYLHTDMPQQEMDPQVMELATEDRPEEMTAEERAQLLEDADEVFVQVDAEHIQKILRYARKQGEIRIERVTAPSTKPFRAKIKLYIERHLIQEQLPPGPGPKEKIQKPSRHYIPLLVVTDNFIKSKDDPRWKTMLAQTLEVEEFLQKLCRESQLSEMEEMSQEESEEQFEADLAEARQQ